MASIADVEHEHVPHLTGEPDNETLHSAEHDKNVPESSRKAGTHAEGENGTQHLQEGEFWEPAEGVNQDDGVTKIEALYLVYGKGWGLFALWASIGLISYIYALSQSTTYYYEAFATSSFQAHTILGTISTITGIMGGVAQPFIAKFADVFSRPTALCVSVVFYTIGYAIVAGSHNVQTVAAGEIIYTLGNTGISFMNGLLISDITSLQWRGAIQGAVSLPFVINAFVAGEIADGIGAYSENGWRWGYGMFCIMVPVLISPSIAVLFLGDLKAKKLGALSLAAPSYYRRQVLSGMEVQHPSKTQMLWYYWRRFNGFGLLLLGWSFALILVPFTLSSGAKGGYNNPSLIAMLVIGGLLFIAWGVWDNYVAAYPIMPKRIFNRTFIACLAIDFMYYFSGYLSDTYLSSWVYVVKADWSDKDYTYFNNILTVGLCGFSVFAGFTQRYFHRYKYQQIAGLALRCVGMGLVYRSCLDPADGPLIAGRVLTSIGGAISVISSQVASQGSVPHQDLAIAIAILALWTQVGGAIASAISASVWNRVMPQKIEKYLGATHNATEQAEIFASIITARATEPHDLVVQAYSEGIHDLLLAALITSFLGLAAGFFTKNYYLGASHNEVEQHKIIRMREKDETSPEAIAAKVKEVEKKVEAEVTTQHHST